MIMPVVVEIMTKCIILLLSAGHAIGAFRHGLKATQHGYFMSLS